MDHFKLHLPDVTMFAYLDDLFVISATDRDHLNHLSLVFEKSVTKDTEFPPLVSF